MGANSIIKSFRACSESELRNITDRACEDAAHEDGHGAYSGTWGTKLNDSLLFPNEPTFLSSNLASEWLDLNCEKSGPLLAIRVANNGKADLSRFESRLETLEERRQVVVRELGVGYPIKDSYLGKIVARVKASKSKLKTCSDCSSKISVEHIRDTDCPVCGSQSYLYTEADIKKFDSLADKLTVLNDNIKDVESDRDIYIQSLATKASNDDWYWMVGGLCRS